MDQRCDSTYRPFFTALGWLLEGFTTNSNANESRAGDWAITDHCLQRKLGGVAMGFAPY